MRWFTKIYGVATRCDLSHKDLAALGSCWGRDPLNGAVLCSLCLRRHVGKDVKMQRRSHSVKTPYKNQAKRTVFLPAHVLYWAYYRRHRFELHPVENRHQTGILQGLCLTMVTAALHLGQENALLAQGQRAKAKSWLL